MESTSQLVLSHKRTSSKAETQNTEQPPLKQTRQDAQDGSRDDSDTSSSSSDGEPPLHGVYIVQYSISESNNDANDSRIVGVYVSEEDADIEVTRQKKEVVDGGANPGDITYLDFQSGWEWVESSKIHICSCQYHPLVWPKRPKLDFVSEESSLAEYEPDDYPRDEAET